MVQALIFLWSLTNYLFSGFVFMKVWNWFTVTTIGLPELSWVSALGLLIVLSFVKPLVIKSKKEEELFGKDSEERLHNTMSISIYLGFILLIGYIIQLFV